MERRKSESKKQMDKTERKIESKKQVDKKKDFEVNPSEASSAWMLESGGTTSEAVATHDDTAQIKKIKIKIFILFWKISFFFQTRRHYTNSSLPEFSMSNGATRFHIFFFRSENFERRTKKCNFLFLKLDLFWWTNKGGWVVASEISSATFYFF